MESAFFSGFQSELEKLSGIGSLRRLVPKGMQAKFKAHKAGRVKEMAGRMKGLGEFAKKHGITRASIAKSG